MLSYYSSTTRFTFQTSYETTLWSSRQSVVVCKHVANEAVIVTGIIIMVMIIINLWQLTKSVKSPNTYNNCTLMKDCQQTFVQYSYMFDETIPCKFGSEPKGHTYYCIYPMAFDICKKLLCVFVVSFQAFYTYLELELVTFSCSRNNAKGGFASLLACN